MKYFSHPSNARRAARAALGKGAKEDVDYKLIGTETLGGQVGFVPITKAAPTKKAKPAKPPRAAKTPAPAKGRKVIGHARTAPPGLDPRDGAKRAGKKFRQLLKEKKSRDKAAGGAWLDQLCSMLSRPQGATAAEVGAAFGWLEHTSRARISVGPRSRNARAERTREDRGGKMVSVYRLATELPLGQKRDELGVKYVKPPRKAKAEKAAA